jgi:hypothetical protein
MAGRLAGGDARVREGRRHARGLRLEATERGGQEPDGAGAPHESLEAAPLMEAQQPSGSAQRSRVNEQEPERDRAPERPPAPGMRMLRLDVAPRRLEQLGIVDARRTGGLTRQAAETVAHLLGELARDLELAVRDGTHQRNAPARAVALAPGRVVRRTGRQAHPAVHALLQDGVVHGAQGRRHLNRKSSPG